MVKEVSGYLARDGTFFVHKGTCTRHDTALALQEVLGDTAFYKALCGALIAHPELCTAFINAHTATDAYTPTAEEKELLTMIEGESYALDTSAEQTSSSDPGEAPSENPSTSSRNSGDVANPTSPEDPVPRGADTRDNDNP